MPRKVKREFETGGGVVRGLRADASPKLNAEILAAELESFTNVALHDTKKAEWLPGATLAHGCAKLPQTLFVFLWGIWLICGPSEKVLRKFLKSIRWVTTDMGVEKCIVAAKCCVNAFIHHIRGGRPQDSPGLDEETYTITRQHVSNRTSDHT